MVPRKFVASWSNASRCAIRVLDGPKPVIRRRLASHRVDEKGRARPAEVDSSPHATRNEGQASTRKAFRTPIADASLRRVTLETERLRSAPKTGGRASGGAGATKKDSEKDVTAYCAAEGYRMEEVFHIVRSAGYVIDPYSTELYPQVIHFHSPALSSDLDTASGVKSNPTKGDVFVFPSGTVVAWNVDQRTTQGLVNGALLPAAINAHTHRIETEDLDYYDDPDSEKSAVIGDTIMIGTRPPFIDVPASQSKGDDPLPAKASAHGEDSRLSGATSSQQVLGSMDLHSTNLTLAKIAFSSGLARSTKLAVLESLLDSYFASTSSIPSLLSAGVRLPASYRNRAFILRKTGELLSVRAQLNLTELTDKVPDLFWDARHELGLESLYDQIGRVLDVSWRIRILNERVDYAAEIAEVLRGSASERHGLLLEWLIIGLIAVEVGFEGWKIWREQFATEEEDDTDALLKRWLRKQLEDVR